MHGEKVLFLAQIFEIDILNELTRFEVPRISKILFLAVGHSVCVINIIQKQIIAEIPNLVFYMRIISRCYLKFS